MEDVTNDRFGWPDYLILGATLALSSAVGIYYGVVGRTKSSMEDYLMAGRNMHYIPVSLSLFVSWMSSISFIGDPVEVYYYGATYAMFAIGQCLALPVVAHVFAPTYYRLKLTSMFEFLEMRYNGNVRIAVSVCVGVGMMQYLSIVLFAAAVALSQVTGLHVWLCIVVVGSICLFYTSLGGIKAVIWADALQFMFMFVGLLAVVVRGVVHLGGLSNVWNISTEGKRINFEETFNPSPFLRSTFWTVLIGGFFRVFNPLISGQIWVQRYCTLRSVRDVQLSIYFMMPMFVLFLVLFTLAGLLLCAMYHTCDPLKAGRISRSDEMMSLMVMDLLRPLPGLAGLFIGSILSASLSTMSSAQSSLATTCMRDVIQPAYKHCSSGSVLSERQNSIIARLISAAVGLVNILLSLSLVLIKNSTVFGLSLTFVNALLAPVSGIFILAVLFPFVKTNSALIGGLVSTVFCCWLMMGTLVEGIHHPRLPTSTTGCTANSFINNYTLSSKQYLADFNHTDAQLTTSLDQVTSHNTSTFISAPPPSLDVWSVYKFSPLLYPAVGPLICVLCALLITALTRLCKKQSLDGVDDKDCRTDKLPPSTNAVVFKITSLTESAPQKVTSF